MRAGIGLQPAKLLQQKQTGRPEKGKYEQNTERTHFTRDGLRRRGLPVRVQTALQNSPLARIQAGKRLQVLESDDEPETSRRRLEQAQGVNVLRVRRRDVPE